MPDVYSAVVCPLVTEKSSSAYGLYKEYTFEAHPKATKRQIRAAIEALFDVKVVRVRTLQQRAKTKTLGQTRGTRSRWKKVYVRLRDGDSIEIFEG